MGGCGVAPKVGTRAPASKPWSSRTRIVYGRQRNLFWHAEGDKTQETPFRACTQHSLQPSLFLSLPPPLDFNSLDTESSELTTRCVGAAQEGNPRPDAERF